MLKEYKCTTIKLNGVQGVSTHCINLNKKINCHNTGSLIIYSVRQGNLGQEKPLISPINLAQISNPRTVLKSARPEDSKTPPEC